MESDLVQEVGLYELNFHAQLWAAELNFLWKDGLSSTLELSMLKGDADKGWLLVLQDFVQILQILSR